MRFTGATVSVVLSFAAAATAQLDVSGLLSSLSPPNPNDPRFTQFKRPGKNDVRSPCPGLNALANHGFIPRNGKGNTIPKLVKGLKAGMNMGADFTIAIGGLGLLSADSPDLLTSFDLNDLDQHNFPIEHDASLSRQDAFFGDNYSFYQPNWDTVLSYFHGQAETDLKSASAAKYARVNDSMTRNPEFTYGPREYILSYGETALYLQTMADPFSGNAKVEYVRSLFEQEKLPYALGWRPSTTPITLTTLGQMVLELSAISPEPIPEGLTVTADGYKNVLELLVGGSEVLGNLTQGLSTAVGL